MDVDERNNKKPGELSRREFLKDAGLIVGGAALGSIAFLNACGGGNGNGSSTSTTKPTPAQSSTTNAFGGYTITYDSNGGTGSVPVDSTKHSVEQTIAVPGNSTNLVYSGYSFVGWQLKADGSGQVYKPGQTFLMGSANVTLYALWAGGYAYVVDENSGSAGSISQYTIGPNGALTAMFTPTVPTGGSNSQLIAADPLGKHVYVSNLSSNTVSQFSIGADGALASMTTPTVSMGAGPGIYYPFGITVHPSGKWAYVAINQRGNVNQYMIGTDGSLAPMIPPSVSAGTYPDFVTVDPTGRWAYVANGDANSVSQFTINQSTGALTPMSPPSVPSGANAYTVAVDPQGKHAYVTSYGTGSVSQYDIDQATGALTPMSAPKVATGASGAISITIDPKGRFAYVTLVPSTPNAVIAQFTINQATGALTIMSTPTVSAGGAAAVRIAVEASGKYAYATCGESGWGSTTVAQYTIDQSTGSLVLMNTATVRAGTTPNGIVTVGK